MSEHPASYLLEEVAAGCGDEATLRHVAGCTACEEYVVQLREGAARFENEGPSPDRFAEEVLRRSKRRGVMWMGVGAAALVAAAAALVLFLRPPATQVVHPGAVAMTDDTSASEPDTRFKGRPQLAAVRLRDGEQERFGTEIEVRGDDRLRVEVSVDGPMMLEVGVLSEDGGWVTLLPARMVMPGTHYTPQAVRFDDDPKPGWVIAGNPEAVARARVTRVFDDVSIIPLRVVKEP